MTIIDERKKVVLTDIEKEAFDTVYVVLKDLRVRNVMGFIDAVTDGEWLYYDEDDKGLTVFEFLDSKDEEEEEE